MVITHKFEISGKGPGFPSKGLEEKTQVFQWGTLLFLNPFHFHRCFATQSMTWFFDIVLICN